ncbi:hypothetical protein D9613_006205 [Agrocybe pediades]|uniref:Origin recognition complex subunit 6 n=1 Tax=Agrocybe pediades TaxID=84607 RepID=A0A8H4QUU0_9AGAR|nr:hypothetical protein D9613_006205 [Agrocybe pediades]
MSGNKHLLESFKASEETTEFAAELLRKAEAKTKVGSGYNIGASTVALAAVCILLASEILNNGEIKRQVAQKSSSINPKEFDRVYRLVKGALDASKDNWSYDRFHVKYHTRPLEHVLNPFLVTAEEEYRNMNSTKPVDELVVKVVVYFFVCASAKVSTIPDTPVYAQNEGLSAKYFSDQAMLLGQNCKRLCLKIRKAVKSEGVSPNKRPSATASASDSRPLLEEEGPQTPTPRRSLRTAPTSASPTKQATQSSPSKLARLPHLLKKAPLRELPSKDSPAKETPKKRPNPVDDDAADVAMPGNEAASPPTKKRKEEEVPVTRTKPTLRSSTASQSRIPPQASPVKNRPATRTLSPLKPVVIVTQPVPPPEALIDESSSEEEEEEDSEPSRRFRPVYLDFKQWNAVDPRLDKLWKQINKKMADASLVDTPNQTKKARRR